MLSRSHIEDIIYGRRRSPFLGGFLAIVSVFYGVVIRLRNLLYGIHVLRSYKLPCPVISVGNITLGGTGKTPAVITLAETLERMDMRPLVVSRGYGRTSGPAAVVVSDGHDVLVSAAEGGDEPVLIGMRTVGVPVVVGADRYHSVQSIFSRFRPDVVILDDGFQHRKLRRDVDIVLIDASDPFGNGKLFPAGILREPATALKRADAVLITHADQAADLDGLKSTVRKKTDALIFSCKHRPIDIVDCCTGDGKPVSVLRRARILAFSGIARPSAFAAMLRSLGAVVAGEFNYPDHHGYDKTELAGIFKKAADVRANMIITTEKDMARLRGLKPEGIWALRIELEVLEKEGWEAFLAGVA